MTIDVSIIITSYNVERYIERAVRSALVQAGVRVEVIVVDDGSTDGTWERLGAMDDPRITRLRMPENGGPGAARNMGFAAATGAWIAVLDGDDALLPGRLERCLACARASHADMVVDNLMRHNEDGQADAPMFAPQPFARLGKLTLARFIRGTLSVFGGHSLGYLKPVFSAAFLKRHGLAYDTSIRIGEDYFLLADALALGGVCAVEPSVGYQYTVRAGSISHRLDLASVERMQTLDQQFMARHRLDAVAQRAQTMRSFLLRETHAYTRLIMALKARSPRMAAQAVLACPSALRHLRQPIGKRLRRGMAAFKPL
ncbi:MAG: glycosyltransferase family 2 protein [Pseudomonadota bacterium]